MSICAMAPPLLDPNSPMRSGSAIPRRIISSMPDITSSKDTSHPCGPLAAKSYLRDLMGFIQTCGPRAPDVNRTAYPPDAQAWFPPHGEDRTELDVPGQGPPTSR